MRSLYSMSVTKTYILKVTQYFQANLTLNKLFYKQFKHWKCFVFQVFKAYLKSIDKSLIKVIKKCNLVSI